MAKTLTTPWDPADPLKTDEDMAAYLETARVEGDPALIAAALGDIAHAKGMTQVARDAGLGRESLYKALSPALGVIRQALLAMSMVEQLSPENRYD